MAKEIIWQRPDGQLAISSLALPMLPGETEPDYLERAKGVILAKSRALPRGGFVHAGYADPADYPLDAHWCHAAWRWSAGAIVVDMPTARSIKADLIRRERNSRLTASDGEMLKRSEQGNAANVAAYKSFRQRLRDMPATAAGALETLTTPTQLDAYAPPWPDEPLLSSGDFRPTAGPTVIDRGLSAVTGQWTARWTGGADGGNIGPALTRAGKAMLADGLSLELDHSGTLTLRKLPGIARDYSVSLSLFGR